MDIKIGWRLLSADFSLQAAEKSNVGKVTLVRDKDNLDKWHKLSEEEMEATVIYVTGSGETIKDAIISANIIAMRTNPVN